MSWIKQLENKFPQIKFRPNHLLSKVAYLKIGGPAELFCHIKEEQLLSDLLVYCFKEKILFNIIGDCSNTLISDGSISGLVIKNDVRYMELLEEFSGQENSRNLSKTSPRWKADRVKGSFKYDFEDLNYDESSSPITHVKVSSGLPLPYLITNSLKQHLTGLQWFAGIPGTVGGAIVNNIHGGTYFFNDLVRSVEVINKEGKRVVLVQKDLGSDYDSSRFHKSGEIIISAVLNLYKGNVEKAKHVQEEWIKRKKIQAKNSLGSVFQNLTADQQKRLKIPTNSIGYVVEHLLQLQGKQIGKAQISKTHAGFIENLGGATAADYLALIKLINKKAKEKLLLKLLPEIVFLGFKDSELAGIL